MFEDTSMVQEFGRYAKRHFGAFNLVERLIASGISFLLIGSATLSAQTPTKIWVDSTADNNWFTGNNWTPTGFPGNTDIVTVNNGTTAQIGAGPDAAAAFLTIGPTPGSTVDVDGGTLTIGSTGHGTIVINAGGTLRLTLGTINSDETLDDGIYVFPSGGFINDTSFVTGSGKLINQSGTLTLSTNNTYTGGTTISGGTIQVGAGGTTGSIVGDVLDDGILAFDRSDLFALSGVISGTGSVTQIGSGTTILTGTNAYSGGTTISAGTLQLGNGGVTGSITGNVFDNGVLAFDRSDSLTFAGIISGTGGVTQIGTGTTILTGANTYSGGTTISAGTLQLGNGGTTGSKTVTSLARSVTSSRSKRNKWG